MRMPNKNQIPSSLDIVFLLLYDGKIKEIISEEWQSIAKKVGLRESSLKYMQSAFVSKPLYDLGKIGETFSFKGSKMAVLS